MVQILGKVAQAVLTGEPFPGQQPASVTSVCRGARRPWACLFTWESAVSSLAQEYPDVPGPLPGSTVVRLGVLLWSSERAGMARGALGAGLWVQAGGRALLLLLLASLGAWCPQ